MDTISDHLGTRRVTIARGWLILGLACMGWVPIVLLAWMVLG